ncbi:hypothetical protein Ciccas_013620 [Cichlidogyrus casuarinus]|uniref:Uncharacterized protein n=1 Tax=Cichlidogyrus casuarinus TaxID=1844966 RepID=A0ABD2PN73_9PLAT
MNVAGEHDGLCEVREHQAERASIEHERVSGHGSSGGGHVIGQRQVLHHEHDKRAGCGRCQRITVSIEEAAEQEELMHFSIFSCLKRLCPIMQ